MALFRLLHRTLPRTQKLLPLLMVALVCGCQGKSLVDDNPVFRETPPRRSLTNRATSESDSTTRSSSIKSVSFTNDASTEELTGNTVVAEVNGTPIFVDDLVGSQRLAMEADPRVSPEQRQSILLRQIKGRLDSYVEQEVVLQSLKQAIPEDRQEVIHESLEVPFQEVIGNIKKDRGVETDDELNDILAQENLSIDLLRESFVRIQMVQGYVQTLATVPDVIDRVDMVNYYQEHQADFTTSERVRWQEIVVRFDKHGGRDGAKTRMETVVRQLQDGAKFGELAMEHSDALSAERRGDMGWLERGGLADKTVEKTLFELEAGQPTQIYVRDDRFEVYRVVDHQQQRVTPFAEVQSQIEQILKQKAAQDAKQKVLSDMRDKATVVTMFDKTDVATQDTIP